MNRDFISSKEQDQSYTDQAKENHYNKFEETDDNIDENDQNEIDYSMHD